MVGRFGSIFILFLSLFAASVSGGYCPNDCSKRGTCTVEGACACQAGWTVAPDCSERKSVQLMVDEEFLFDLLSLLSSSLLAFYLIR
jgi:hypothetical protein